jgi:thymidylate synthase
MNKYHDTLLEIIEKGRLQENKKGSIQYLHNHLMKLSPADLLDIFEGHSVPRNKLKGELNLFMQGERNTDRYREIGVSWWDYCGPVLINSYPTYFEKLPGLIDKINNEKRPSKNYVLYLGATAVETNQQPCLSLIQFQFDHKGRLVITAFQRSSDASLGLPADIYHLYLISRQIDAELKSITLLLSNVHIYTNNIDLTKRLIAGEPVKFNLNVD